jgi:hypothetical protein
MGATMSKTQELDVIKSGRIHYKDVEIQESSVRFFGTTAIVLNKIRLVAVVGGNEVDQSLPGHRGVRADKVAPGRWARSRSRGC